MGMRNSREWKRSSLRIVENGGSQDGNSRERKWSSFEIVKNGNGNGREWKYSSTEASWPFSATVLVGYSYSLILCHSSPLIHMRSRPKLTVT